MTHVGSIIPRLDLGGINPKSEKRSIGSIIPRLDLGGINPG